jgi:lysine 2,3-aminomutase
MIRDIDGLIRAGWAAEADRASLEAVGERYAIAIPPALAALIGDARDPIGRQFVPHADERQRAPHENPDPIGDDALSPLPGIVHRYADRVLLKPLLVCPVYCRFCFRREHVGPDGGLLTQAQLDAAYAWISERPAVREVILTGGDPLMLSPRRLGAIMAALSAIPHVETIRLHSRLPVASPNG